MAKKNKLAFYEQRKITSKAISGAYRFVGAILKNCLGCLHKGIQRSRVALFRP
jgi:hypothetical protein